MPNVRQQNNSNKKILKIIHPKEVLRKNVL